MKWQVTFTTDTGVRISNPHEGYLVVDVLDDLYWDGLPIDVNEDRVVKVEIQKLEEKNEDDPAE